MTRYERLDIGEKIVVGAFVGCAVVEVLLTIFAVMLVFTWTTVLLGAVFVGFLLFLANWIYSGNVTAWKVAIAWGSFQVVLAFIGVFTSHNHHPAFAAHIGMPVVWLALVKAVVYALFVGFLALSSPVRDFLSLRRGEAIADETPQVVEVPLSGVSVPLTDAQAAAFGTLTCWMQWAGGLLIAAGVLRFLAGLYAMPPVLDYSKILPGLPAVIEGVAVGILGVYLFAPASALALFKSRDLNHLMRAFKSLQALYFTQLIILAVSAVAVGLGIVAKFM